MLFSHNAHGTGQQCCYDEVGDILPFENGGGTMHRAHAKRSVPRLSHLLEDVWPQFLCCKFSDNCNKYREVRPTDNCRRFEPPVIGEWRSVYLCLSLSVSVCLCLSMYVCLSIYVCICLSVYVCLCMYVCLSMYVYVCLYVCLCLSLLVSCLSVCLSASLSLSLSLSPSLPPSLPPSLSLSLSLSLPLSRLFVFSLFMCRMLRIICIQRKTNIWVRDKVGFKEEKRNV